MTSRNDVESSKAIQKCDYSCVVCGWKRFDRKGNPLVDGAHIKPFNSDYSSDKFDNIIALCPNHHRQFDRFLFYIDPQNMNTIFIDKTDEYNDVDISSKIKYVKKEHLAYRQYLFEKENKLIGV